VTRHAIASVAGHGDALGLAFVIDSNGFTVGRHCVIVRWSTNPTGFDTHAPYRLAYVERGTGLGEVPEGAGR
jgi:hypothetical protein